MTSACSCHPLMLLLPPLAGAFLEEESEFACGTSILRDRTKLVPTKEACRLPGGETKNECCDLDA